MPAYSVPSGNISGMTFGGSSLAPKTSPRPKRRPTYAETQANESATDQSNNSGSSSAPATSAPAAGNTPTFMLGMTQAQKDAIERYDEPPEYLYPDADSEVQSTLALRDASNKIGFLDLLRPLGSIRKFTDTSGFDQTFTNEAGQTISQRPDGTYYSKNFLGLPYEVNKAGEDITDYQQSKDLQAFMDRNKDRNKSDGSALPVATAPVGAADPESTIFNPNNAFLRNRMRMYQDQGGGIMPPAGGVPPVTGGPYIPPPQMPMLPAPNMPPQLRGIMGLADRSNISPAMRYAAENYYRLGGRQMMNDEFERGRAMIQGQSV
tara:strand:- start:15 stop:974 length:960 start_codon:yes stop_codon:yes gene_type:complete